MKKTFSLLLLALVSSTIFAQNSSCNNKSGQTVRLNAKNLPSHVEVFDQEGRKVTVEFLSKDKKECRISLTNFHPDEKYICSTDSFGEAFSSKSQVVDGKDEFLLDLTGENSSDKKAISTIKVVPLDSKDPLKILINWG